MRTSGLWTALIVAGVLSACSGAPATEPVAEELAVEQEVEAPAEAEPVEETTPAPPAEFLTNSWTDADGYSYTFVAYEPGPVIVLTDVANAKPGEVILSATSAIGGYLSNTTPERIAPVPSQISIVPVWDVGSPACLAFPRMDLVSDGYCGAHNSGDVTSMTPAYEIAAGTGLELTSKVLVGKTEEIIVGTELVVPEADLPAIVAALENPTGWVLATPGGVSTACNVGAGLAQSLGVTAFTAGLAC